MRRGGGLARNRKAADTHTKNEHTVTEGEVQRGVWKRSSGRARLDSQVIDIQETWTARSLLLLALGSAHCCFLPSAPSAWSIAVYCARKSATDFIKSSSAKTPSSSK